MLSHTIHGTDSRVLVSTYIPELNPANEVGVVDLALGVNVLTRAHHHCCRWRNIYEGRLARICVRDPDGHGEAVCAAAKVDRKGAGEVHEQGTGAIRESWDDQQRLQNCAWTRVIVL